jgi:hypothetical protein
MHSARRRALLPGAVGLLLGILLLTPVSPAAAQRVKLQPLLSSHELWATIDVCNPADQPNAIGVRGSMPGDGESRDRMYMSVRLQYLSRTSRQWTDLGGIASPGFIPVGGGGSARQGGLLLTLKAMPAGSPAQKFRGVVDFQWREGKKVVYAASRATSAGHVSLAGADPRGFTAATCRIG